MYVPFSVFCVLFCVQMWALLLLPGVSPIAVKFVNHIINAAFP
jgi:hypothetical protein